LISVNNANKINYYSYNILVSDWLRTPGQFSMTSASESYNFFGCTETSHIVLQFFWLYSDVMVHL